MSTPILILIVAAVGYLLGSINTSIVVSKLLEGYDIRTRGSGNAGLTNSYRNMGAKRTVLVLLGDVIKTVLACLLGSVLFGALGVLIAGSAAMIGHMFPLYFRLKGGKGVLVGVTMLAMFDLRIFAIVVVIFVLLVAATRWVSLGSIIGAGAAPFLTLYFYWNNAQVVPMTALVFCMAGLIIYRHRSNMVRIAHGNENKFSFHRKKAE